MSSGQRACDSTEYQSVNELFNCQKTTTEKFLPDAEMSLQGEYLDSAQPGLRGAVPADSHNIGGTPNTPS